VLHNFRLLWIVTPFQVQHVAVPGEDNCLPPAIARAVITGDHQMSDSNVVPASRQPRRRLVGRRLISIPWHRLTGELQLLNDLAVQASPD
jgi:hypothetical protein